MILRSERGSQSISAARQQFLNRDTLLSSATAVGHCGDIVACERFLGLLKRDRGHRRYYPAKGETQAELFDYIERFQNP